MSGASAAAERNNECGFVHLDKSLAFTLDDADISLEPHCEASSCTAEPELGEVNNAEADELAHHLQDEVLSLKEGIPNASDDSSICSLEQSDGFESSCVGALVTGSHSMLGHTEKAVEAFSECGSLVAEPLECSRDCSVLSYLSVAINDKAHGTLRLLYCSEVKITRQVSAGLAKVIDCLAGKYSNWSWKAGKGASEAESKLSSPSTECVTLTSHNGTLSPSPEAGVVAKCCNAQAESISCNAQAESIRDKAFNKFNKSLLVRVREYLDNFSDQVIDEGGPFYLPIPAEVLLSDAERSKFHAMCEVMADGSSRLRARGM